MNNTLKTTALLALLTGLLVVIGDVLGGQSGMQGRELQRLVQHPSTSRGASPALAFNEPGAYRIVS